MIDASNIAVTTPPPVELVVLHTTFALVPEPMKAHPVVQLEFQVLARWLLPDSA